MFKILKLGELEPLNVGLFSEIVSRIDFSPIYQRYGGIWSLERKKLLIDSIINGFDIPKFYFNYFVEENNVLNPKGYNYAIIDGKQRLQAILDFKNNKFPLSDNSIFYEDENVKISKLKYSELAVDYPFIASRIDNFILDIVYIVTDEEDKLEELFLRLNGGYALTNAEKRNAIGGFLNREIRQIVETHSFFKDKLRFNNPRFQYQDTLTRLLFLEQCASFVSLTNTALEKFVRDNSIENDDIKEVIDKTLSGLEQFVEIFEDKDILLRGKGIIPVYYFFITRLQPEQSNFRDFIEQFENIRFENRQLPEESQEALLIDFDRRNQQGVHRDKSLEERFIILDRYYKQFLQDGLVSLKSKVNLSDIEIDNDDEMN